jgi:hypothetical protein
MKTLVLLISFILASVHPAEAQQLEGRVPRIGFLGAGSASALAARLDAFLQGMHDLGYIEGLLPIQATKNATKTIPSRSPPGSLKS